MTDIDEDSDVDIPVITRIDNWKKTPPVKINLNSGGCIEMNESNNLSTTDINSDNDLPDIGINNYSNDSIVLPQDFAMDISPSVETSNSSFTSSTMRKHNPSTSCEDLSNGGLSECKKTSFSSEQKIPLEISDDSDDSILSVSEKSNFPVSLLERCKQKTKFMDDNLSESNKICRTDEEVESVVVLPDLVENDGDQENYTCDSKLSTTAGAFCEKTKPSGKRTKEEIAESKREAEMKKANRELERKTKKAEKEREKLHRKIEQESKRHFRPGECVKYLTVCVDPGIINNNVIAAPLFKVCSDLDVKCITETQLIPNSITWRREIIDTSQSEECKKMEITEDNVLVMIPISDFLKMIHLHARQQHGIGNTEGLTLKEYIQSVQACCTGMDVSMFVLGIENYFKEQRLAAKRQFREEIRGAKSKKKNPANDGLPIVSDIEMEEALVDAQLHTGCIVKLLDKGDDVADVVKTFTKAVADKPAKKDRLNNPFSFLEEGTSGVKVDKNGCGLLKVWKHQLLQFPHLGPEMAEAIVKAYPSPRMLFEAYKRCLNEKEELKLLENIVVRRGAGVLVTNRRIGKELSKRIHSFMTSRDPSFVLK